MSQGMKTLAFVIVAAALFFMALTTTDTSVEPDLYKDVGQLFFPEFKEPEQVGSLQVSQYSEETAELQVFSVKKKAGIWEIPSHHNYPANATQRMSQAAGLFIGAKKEDIRSDSRKDHESLGVMNPTKASGSKGSGLLVSFKTNTGGDLAELIIGKAIEGRKEMHFVRIPGKSRVYVSKIPSQLSTTFSEWIETDLLSVSEQQITDLEVNSYFIEEGRSLRIVEGEVLKLSKPVANWELETMALDEKVDEASVKEILRTLDNLKISGVRPKPEALANRFMASDKVEATREMFSLLAPRGFFLTPEADIVANQGELSFHTKEGVLFKLYFGEILRGTGKEITAGSLAPKEEQDAKEEENEADKSNANRYLLVTVKFDESVLDRPQGVVLDKGHLDMRQKAYDDIVSFEEAIKVFKESQEKLPAKLSELVELKECNLAEIPKDPWGNSYAYSVNSEGGYVITSYSEDAAPDGEKANSDIRSDRLAREESYQKFADDMDEFNALYAKGQEKATELRKAFAPWFYVIDEESFEKLQPKREKLIAKPESADSQPKPPAFPPR